MARSRRNKGRPINGWLCLDKPEGMTSTAAVALVKRATKAAKVGHGGTLDPLATGVLPIAMGEATKTVAFVMDGEKQYRFTMKLGAATNTDDSEGEIIETSDVRPRTAEIEAALGDFVGEIEQVPPCFAAVKVAGERAYDIARRGETVELEARTVEVKDLTIVERPDDDHIVFDLTCGKGTYVRAIARDLGRQLGCFGHVSALRRMKVGAFEAEQAVSPETLERLIEDDAFPQVLRPLNDALAALPSLALTEPQAERLRAGQTIRVAPHMVKGPGVQGDGPGGSEDEDTTIRAMASGDVVALARLTGAELSPVRVFNLRVHPTSFRAIS
ncbi:MAG: tRNA pseudouridine(55) synthase TruB [Alphaproteobacteria bacterium]|nr:tRNA pseudouridine(55) synthase TruB [Alphaproteobacteria bacterium]